jgi:hypothetical protein
LALLARPKKRDKRKKKRSGGGGGGGGRRRLSGMRTGFKGFVGTGGKQKKKESTLSKVITIRCWRPPSRS